MTNTTRSGAQPQQPDTSIRLARLERGQQLIRQAARELRGRPGVPAAARQLARLRP